MADEDKIPGKPLAPDPKEILKALRSRPIPGARTELFSGGPSIPKPMIIGPMIPKGGASGPLQAKPKEVMKMLKDIGVDIEKVHNSGTNTYITYKVPGQKPEDFGDQPPQIRIANPKYQVHAGSPKSLEDLNIAGLNFIDTAGQHTGEKLPAGAFGKFIKNEQGDYYNTLDAIKNAVLWRTGQGLVPPGTEPSKIWQQPFNNPIKLPPDPNQLDFMHMMYENRGTQKPNNIVGGNPENLWHSSQMPQRLGGIDTSKDFGVGMLPAIRQGQNFNFPRNAPRPPGMSDGEYGTYNQKYMEMMRLLAKSKGQPTDKTVFPPESSE